MNDGAWQKGRKHSGKKQRGDGDTEGSKVASDPLRGTHGAYPGKIPMLTRPEAETAWTAFQATAAPKKPQSHLVRKQRGGHMRRGGYCKLWLQDLHKDWSPGQCESEG